MPIERESMDARAEMLIRATDGSASRKIATTAVNKIPLLIDRAIDSVRQAN